MLNLHLINIDINLLDEDIYMRLNVYHHIWIHLYFPPPLIEPLISSALTITINQAYFVQSDEQLRLTLKDTYDLWAIHRVES